MAALFRNRRHDGIRVVALVGEDIGMVPAHPTESNHGSDPGSMMIRAPKVGGSYSLSGPKMWITNSPIADVFVVWAKDDESKIHGVVLEKGRKGLSAPTIHGKAVMDDVFCPEVNVFPEVRGLKGPFTCLNSAAMGSLGARWAPSRTAPRYR